MSGKQVTRTLSLLGCLLLLFLARGAMLPIILALILFYCLHPMSKLFARAFPKKFPLGKDLAILAAFVVFILVCLLLFEFVVPPFTEEFSQLSLKLPQFIDQLQTLFRSSQQWYAGFRLPGQVDQALSNSLNSAYNYISSFLQQLTVSLIMVLSQFIGFIVIPVLAYYLLKDDDTLPAGMLKLVPVEHQDFFRSLVSKINYILKSYVEGQLVICSLIGLVTGLGLWLMGVKFFLVLGLIAGVTELIPIIGPIIGAVPAVIIALLISPSLAIAVIIFYLVLQTIGAYVLVPKLMGNKLDLHPLTILLGVLILGNLIGVWGIFFAAPIIAILKVLYLELRKN